MTDPKSIEYIMYNTPNNVNLLLDVGHLKVSANTLGFNKDKAHEQVKKWIKAYHLSENDGKEDTNSLISNKSWFLQKLKPVNSYTLEVYNSDINLIKKQVDLINKALHGKKNNIKNLLVDEKSSLRKIISVINSNRFGACFVTSKSKFKAVITDGDIRRLILRNHKLNKNICSFVNRKKKYNG